MTTTLPDGWTPNEEDVVRLRVELHVEPLEAVAPFVEHCRARAMRSHDFRAEFREFVRKRSTEPAPKSYPLEPQESAAHARALLATLDNVDTTNKIGRT